MIRWPAYRRRRPSAGLSLMATDAKLEAVGVPEIGAVKSCVILGAQPGGALVGAAERYRGRVSGEDRGAAWRGERCHHAVSRLGQAPPRTEA